MSLSSAPFSRSETRPAVFVVEDERPFREMLTLVLEERFEVTAAASAEEAEACLRNRSFHVVVCDHRMPGSNGLQFLARVRETHPRTRRILVTGFLKPEMVESGTRDAALHRYLQKPVELAEFSRIVEEAARAYEAA